MPNEQNQYGDAQLMMMLIHWLQANPRFNATPMVNYPVRHQEPPQMVVPDMSADVHQRYMQSLEGFNSTFNQKMDQADQERGILYQNLPSQ